VWLCRQQRGQLRDADRHGHQHAGPAIRVGTQPEAIAITPDGKTAYVANEKSGTVTPVDTATNTARAAIKVGAGPDAIAIAP
jgi:YVTN family beta-propeller protein